jgi:AsmA family
MTGHIFIRCPDHVRGRHALMQPVQAVARKRGIQRWVVAVAALLVAAAVVAPPLISLNGLHRRIADSISQAIGRPVRMSSITLRLIPRPGFEIADFVVDEDPAFGAEPILRSSQVIASVRILPLWRGRLEIARIAFDEPSVNLVRNREGRWNFDALLSQAAQIPKAPTAERHPGGLPRFPYIDASNARVNFKYGDEKLPFSFFNSDLAVWLEYPGEWRIEFAAQPVRTDLSLDLANTGSFRLDGSLRHAATLREMPMQLRVQWSNAPLGQLSKILTGSDADWRGQLDASADITGSIDHENIKLTASGHSIHRSEFDPREPLNINVTCQARFSRADRLFDALTCLAPTGDGHLLLTGSIRAVPGMSDPALSLELNNVPAASALDGVRLVRAGFVTSLVATGAIDGNFTYTSLAGTKDKSLPARVRGEATVNRLTLTSPALQKPLALPTLHFSLNAEAPERPHRRRAKQSAVASAERATLMLEPFALRTALSQVPSTPAAKLPASMTVSGAFDWNGFSVHLGGESHVGELIALSKEFGLLQHAPVDLDNMGTADLNLTVHGPWMLPVTDQPVAPAAFDGTVRLHNAQLTGDFLAQAMRIPAAQAVFDGNDVAWTASAVTYGPVRADVTLTYPSFCTAPTGCVPHFGLHIASLDAATAQIALLGAQRHGELVERLLDRIRSLNQSSPKWPALAGTVQIGALTIQELPLRDVTATVGVGGNGIHMKSASARTLNGELQLSGTMEVDGSNTPRYQLDAQLDHASAGATAALFGEKWSTGSIDLRTSLRFSGFEQKELLSSATGTFHWEWTRGGWPVEGPSTETSDQAEAGAFSLSHFDSWIADGVVANSALNLQRSQILNGGALMPVTGTISFARELSLSTLDKTTSVRITGTLQRPLIHAEPATTATSTAP